MNYRRTTLDQIPVTMLDAAGQAFAVRDRLEATEHNVEDLLLCLQSLRPDDVPAMHWNWDENAWHPESLPEEQYPQCFARHVDHDSAEYHAIWSAPICGRDPTRPWRDGERYLEGVGRQSLLFDYRFEASLDSSGGGAAPARLLYDSLSVVVAMHEETPLRRAFASGSGNKLKVDLQLLIKLMQWIDELNAYLRLEQQALGALERRAARHADHNLHTND